MCTCILHAYGQGAFLVYVSCTHINSLNVCVDDYVICCALILCYSFVYGYTCIIHIYLYIIICVSLCGQGEGWESVCVLGTSVKCIYIRTHVALPFAIFIHTWEYL